MYDDLFLRDVPGVKKVLDEMFFPEEKISFRCDHTGCLAEIALQNYNICLSLASNNY